MAASLKEVRDLALSLSEMDRESLADDLLVSLQRNTPEQAGIGEAWRTEIERRKQQVKDGTVKLLDGDEVINRLRGGPT